MFTPKIYQIFYFTGPLKSRDPHDPLITRGSPFAIVSDQKHNITCGIPPSQSRPVRAQF
jgi:hypothetical protein